MSRLYDTAILISYHHRLDVKMDCVMGQAYRISCRQARDIDIVMYLGSLGFVPAKVRGDNHWYHSPLRNEHTPSFKVNRRLNRWYDFGMGKGGNLLDFGILFFGCSTTDFLSLLSTGALLPAADHIHVRSVPPPGSKIEILSARPIKHPALIQYLSGRNIPLAIADRYCQEVGYRNAGRNFFAIGFKNRSGGYELRSRNFKGSSAPKYFTLVSNGADSLAVFEGFFDFLSYLILAGQQESLPTDYLILNSLSFLDKALPLTSGYRQTFLFLDNNPAGRNRTIEVLKSNPAFIDQSALFHGYEDLNDYLCRIPSTLPANDPSEPEEPP